MSTLDPKSRLLSALSSNHGFGNSIEERVQTAMNSQTPQNTYLTGHTPSATQHHEWRTAENSASHLLPTLIAKSSQTPHLTLLDIGAGSGTITASLAQYIPHGAITALDASPEILQKAAAHAKSVGVKNIEFKQGDAYALPFEDEAFDIVHASMVLAHLSDPVKAIREMVRVAKRDGGVISLRESDLRAWSFWPHQKGISEFQDVLCRVQVLNGGYADAGQRLISWVLEAGVERERLKASAGAWCFSSEEEKRVWGGTMVDRCDRGKMRERALQERFASERDFEAMKGAWARWIKSDMAWFGCLNGEILVFM